jgi:hypothetical protein
MTASRRELLQGRRGQRCEVVGLRPMLAGGGHPAFRDSGIQVQWQHHHPTSMLSRWLQAQHSAGTCGGHGDSGIQAYRCSASTTTPPAGSVVGWHDACWAAEGIGHSGIQVYRCAASTTTPPAGSVVGWHDACWAAEGMGHSGQALAAGMTSARRGPVRAMGHSWAQLHSQCQVCLVGMCWAWTQLVVLPVSRQLQSSSRGGPTR